MQRPGDDRRGGRRFDVVGVLTLFGLILLGLVLWWVAPSVLGLIKHQDCIGSGATNC